MGSNNGFRTLSIKAVTVSAAVLSTAVILHLAGPSFVQFSLSEIPKIYGSMIAWLTPPYLYFVVNGIIISIAASSRFQTGSGSRSEELIGSGSATAVVADPPEPVKMVEEEYVVPAEYGNAEEEEEEEEFVISRSSWEPKKETETDNVTVTEYSFLSEKPLVSSRLGRRKSLKASPEASRALGVARPKRNDTLESTWKAITDGRNVPLTRHLKKSDTWETHHTRGAREAEPSRSPDHLTRKSETFNERPRGRRPPVSPVTSSAAGWLRKEPSLGQDDLNRRVEAFIRKFNEEMRLQRQESFKHYMDMINRGAH